jgi:hypothetical protein
MSLSLVSFEPQGSLPSASVGRDPVGLAAQFQHKSEGDDGYRHRMRMNLLAAAAVAVVLGAGMWIADAMVDAQKAHGCYTSGQRFCSLI